LTEKAKLAVTDATYASNNTPSYHATFGSGHDLYISSNANNTNDSYSELPNGYSAAPNG